MPSCASERARHACCRMADVLQTDGCFYTMLACVDKGQHASLLLLGSPLGALLLSTPLPARHCCCRWYDEIIKHTSDIAAIMTMESGKTTAEAKAEILSGCGACLRPAAVGPPEGVAC